MRGPYFNGVLSAVLLLAVLGALVFDAAAAQEGETALPEKPIIEVLQAHTPRLVSIPGVVGVGEGRCADAPCIKIMVIEKTPELEQEIGGELDGYPVEIIESGEIRAINSD